MINRIGKTLSTLATPKIKRTQINLILNEMGDIATDSTEIQWVIRSTLNNPRLSSCGPSLLCPPSAGAQGKWLQTKFCVLAL